MTVTKNEQSPKLGLAVVIICFGFVFGSLACWSRLDYGPLVLAWMFLYATFSIQNL